MAGHSKWANIKYRKSAQDAKRGKLFTKLLREIVVAVKVEGVDSSRLRQAKEKAMALNMPRSTIDRAIKRAAGGDEDIDYQTIIYEGYGPAGSALYIEALTDNKNRCVAEIRHSLNRYGGRLGTNGSVAYLFYKSAVMEVKDVASEEQLLQDAVDEGAKDVQAIDGGNFYIQTDPTQLVQLEESLNAKGYQLGYKDIVMIPHQPLVLSDSTVMQKLRQLLNSLADLDDVANVYSNVVMAED